MAPRAEAEVDQTGHVADVKQYKAKSDEKKWGRHYGGSWKDMFLASLILVCCPPMVIYFWTSCVHYQCAMSGPLMDFLAGDHKSFGEFILPLLPVPSTYAVQIFFAWLLFQIALYVFLPGPTGYGQLTPAGHALEYKVNGLNAWIFTHVVLAVAVFKFELFPASVIADNWGALLVIANVYGYALSTFAYFKAYLAPTHAGDCKPSGGRLYDFFMGIELNPRIGMFDFKLFHNGRPGILAWSLINISFAAKQYNDFGYITNSMVIINILHLIYILDFFYHEDWYLRTIDIAHDHFGFYLSWGDSVWLPWMYTLQAFYLSINPVDLHPVAAASILALGFSGYFIFRSVNSQKDTFRSDMAKHGKATIWGKPATYVAAVYYTGDGEKRTSYLLTSGWWGLSRHFNYVGDLMLSLSFCLTCGISHLLPYFYIVYMTILLVHRTHRDDSRCSLKYGKSWTKYCNTVTWKILPGVY